MLCCVVLFLLLWSTFFPVGDFRELEERKMSAAEMKTEVEEHMKKKAAIESVLPVNIMIGPFYVNTDGVRQGVSKKHRAIANAVLDLLAKKLRMQAEEVSQQFHYNSKLYTRCAKKLPHEILNKPYKTCQ